MAPVEGVGGADSAVKLTAQRRGVDAGPGRRLLSVAAVWDGPQGLPKKINTVDHCPDQIHRLSR